MEGNVETLEIEKEYIFDADGVQYDEDEHEAEDPHAQGMGGDLTSAVLGIIKGMVGPAILYLPHGFAKAGYVLALPILALTTAMYLYSSSCLLEAWKLESEQVDESGVVEGRRRKSLSYQELARRALGPPGEMMVKSGVALMQSGVCLTYLIFVPHNLHVSLHALFGINASTRAWLLLMVIVQVPLSWIRNIRRLTVTNFAANVLILYGLITCLGFAIENASAANPGRGPVGSFIGQMKGLQAFSSSWFLFIGTSVSVKGRSQLGCQSFLTRPLLHFLTGPAFRRFNHPFDTFAGGRRHPSTTTGVPIDVQESYTWHHWVLLGFWNQLLGLLWKRRSHSSHHIATGRAFCHHSAVGLQHCRHLHLSPAELSGVGNCVQEFVPDDGADGVRGTRFLANQTECDCFGSGNVVGASRRHHDGVVGPRGELDGSFVGMSHCFCLPPNHLRPAVY